MPKPGKSFSLMILLAMLPLALLASACSGLSSLEPGDCAKRNEDGSFSPADCSEQGADYRVLARIEDNTQNCYDVPGVTNRYRSGDVDLCFGHRNVDPATAVNVAQPGDCLSEIDRTPTRPGQQSESPRQTVRRVDCASSEAVYRVINRLQASNLLNFNDECADTPGTTATYTWWLHDDEAIAGIQNQIVFCLSPKDVDPQSSPDLAQVGDCLATASNSRDLVRVDCGDPQARYRVLHRDDNAALGAELACRRVPGTISHFHKPLGLAKGYALCLGSA